MDLVSGSAPRRPMAVSASLELEGVSGGMVDGVSHANSRIGKKRNEDTRESIQEEIDEKKQNKGTRQFQQPRASRKRDGHAASHVMDHGATTDSRMLPQVQYFHHQTCHLHI